MKFPEVLKLLRQKNNLNQMELAKIIGVSRSAISMYESGQREPDFETLETIADYFNVSMDYLHGKTLYETYPNNLNLPEPTITENYTTFPVIGEVAAGFEHQALENWEGDTVNIPDTYLKGRDKSEFFVLRVKGDSMYPEYQDGDRVLILKQPTVNYSGQVGVVIYDDELGTLKKVEYKQGESWLRLVAINPAYSPKKIENENLDHCRILGIPKLIIREVEE